jgi:DNA polymerase III subunit epsilon
MAIKLFYFDTETTGPRFWANGIHQLAGIIEIDGVEKERFEFKIKIHPAAVIEDEALAVSGVTREDLVSFKYF